MAVLFLHLGWKAGVCFSHVGISGSIFIINTWIILDSNNFKLNTEYKVE